MRLTRARYITICQQFMVTAVVATVGASAAGVMTLQIVAPEARAPRVGAGSLAPPVNDLVAPSATGPVTPTVREVRVAALVRPAARIGQVHRNPATGTGNLVLAALSAPTPVRGFGTVGVTWKAGIQLPEKAIRVDVRTMSKGAWSGWTNAAYHDEHGPDAGTTEAARATRPGTDPVVVGSVDEVQMRVETLTGTAPADLELAVIDPGTGTVTSQPAAIDTSRLPASDRDATSAAPIESTAGLGGSGAVAGDGGQPREEAPATAPGSAGNQISLSAMSVAPKPLIYSRAQWGANESLRDASSLHYGTVQTGFIHHTVNANNYTADQVPALIRGIYAYHTQSRGWSDIGYNFLVDRFGRIWEGRYGGVDRAVVGAHTLGYNEYSFAMSSIGNFDIAEPPQAILDAYASLFAWKLSLYNIRADASHLWVKDRYVFAINGHRDVDQTACPGRYLYARIPSIRVAAQAIQDRAQIPPDPVNRTMIPAPAGLLPPTTAPKPAKVQPSITFPLRTSLAGSSWPDLVVKSVTGAIQVVPTNGMLGYSAPITSGGDWSPMDLIAAVGDVTGDGHPDVLARNQGSGVAKVFTSDGLGHVTRLGIQATRRFTNVRSIVGISDFNRDRTNDVVGVDRTTGSLELFPGNGHGAFGAPVVLMKNWPFTQVVGVGDITGDRQPDLVGLRGDSVYLVAGKPGGTALAKPVLMTTSTTPVSALLGWGDLTGDGRPDVMVRDTSGLTRIVSGVGAGRLGQVYGPFGSLAGVRKPSLGPMVGSAAADVVGRNAAGQLVVVPNNGLTNLGAPLPTNLKVPTATQVLDVGDWNRDGNNDVVVRTAGGDLLVLYPGLGNGRFGQPRSLGSGWKAITRLTAVGDVTGDGYPDLMGAIGSGPLTIFPGAGANACKPPALAPPSLRTFNQIGGAAWSPQGSTFSSSDGSFVPFLGNDVGSALRAANGPVAPAYDAYVGVGDVNGDGVADVLAREKGTGTIWLLPGKTSGGLAPRVWVATGFAGYPLIG
jgi:hypothetical protein